ncbi:MAG: transglycosylase domain-containing protein, partial [bacterium]|nr:transglycosylase domain-containing protein [bacterium]
MQLAALSVFSAFVFIPVSTHIYYATDLSSPERIMNRKDTGVILLDRKGRPFFTFHDAKNRKFTPIEEIPKHAQDAIIVMEDREFWKHKGVSAKSIVRAAFVNIRSGELKVGGSTITQQLAKNALLTPKKSFVRKYQEVILAREIEEKYTKDKIFEMYANSVYFGRRGAFGIGEATRAYFDKDPQDLTIAEAAFLSAILPAPSYYANNQDEAFARQRIVLEEMRQAGYISNEQKDEAEKSKLTMVSEDDAIVNYAPHFAFAVYDDLLKKYSEEEIERSGFKVRTSLDLDWQEYAETSIRRHVASLAFRQVSNGAAVVMDPKTGEIRAMVGSKD